MRTFYAILGGVAVIGSAVVVSQIVGGLPGDAATEPVELVMEDDAALLEMATGITHGDPDHEIEIMLFVDYQCPSCRQFALMVEPQIKVRLVETGRAKFVQYDFVTGSFPHSFLAARAARCAGDQGLYNQYHDILFRNQDEWSYETEASGSFSEYAEEIGLDEDEFDACLHSDRHAEVVTANLQLARGLLIRGTPSVVLRAPGRLQRIGSNAFAEIERLVTEIEAGSTPD